VLEVEGTIIPRNVENETSSNTASHARKHVLSKHVTFIPNYTTLKVVNGGRKYFNVRR
jgi:hypothetical protein